MVSSRASGASRSLTALLSSADHLDHEPLVAPAVELGVEDRLPRAEVEPAVGARDDRLVVADQVLEVGVAVVLAAAVVPVVAATGQQLARDLGGRRAPARRRDLV